MSFWDELSNTFTNIFQPVEKAVVQPISHGLANLDNFVHNNIPGGWGTIGAATLMAIGIANPELLSLANNGELTSTALVNAGEDPALITSQLSTLSNEAIANGFTDAAQYADATLNGFTDAATYEQATNAGFSTMADYTAATDAGFSTMSEVEAAASNAGFSNSTDYLASLNQAAPPWEAPVTAPVTPEPAPVNPIAGETPTVPGSPSEPLFGGQSVANLQPVELNGESGYLGENGQIYNADGTLNNNLTSYYNTNIATTPPGNPVAGPGTGITAPPGEGGSIDITGLPGTVENPPPVGTTLPDGTQLATTAQQTEAINGTANGAYFDSASNSWVIPKDIVAAASETGLTTTQVVAAGGATAAIAAVAASGGAGATTTFSGASATPPTTTTPTTPTTPSNPTTPTTPSNPTTPTTPSNPTTPTTPSNPTTPTTPSNPPANIHDYSTPYTMPDGTPVDTTGWSAADIAKAIAAGYIINAVANAVTAKPNLSGYQQQFFPIPTYNASGLVNPGVNPGFIEPSPMYNNGGIPGVDQYYWGQHGYAQTMADLANLNNNAVNAPSTPYGNPNAVNLGRLADFNYPNQASIAGAYGSLAAAPNQAPETNMSYDIYTNPVQMNTATPSIAGFSGTYGPNTQQQMATGQGSAQGYGQSLNYAVVPQQLATVNNSGMTPASQLTNVDPVALAAQLQATASSFGK